MIVRLGCFILFLFASCQLYRPEKKEDNSLKDFLLLSLVSIPQTDPNQFLFRFLPVFRNSIEESQFLDPRLAPQSTKTKLVWIHGWNPLERGTTPNSSTSQKVANISATFRNGLVHYQLNRNLASDSFDLFLYTYRTSESILYNGESFARFLNLNFNPTDRVLVLAHSMGGLVTRAAIRSSIYKPDMIDGVVTLGSPIFGSPFSNRSYLNNTPILTEIVSFLTETEGGLGLKHWNGGLNQVALTDGENRTLQTIETGFPEKPAFFYYYGNLTNNCISSDFDVYLISCNLLKNSNPAFLESDGIVPKNSAIRGGSLGAWQEWEGFDHSMLSFQSRDLNSTRSIRFFEAVMERLKQF